MSFVLLDFKIDFISLGSKSKEFGVQNTPLQALLLAW